MTAVAALLALTVATAPAAAPAPRGAPLLWRVEKYGKTSHLFGTVHLALDLDAALGEEGRTALANAKRVFLELDFAPENLMEFLGQAVARAELPEKDSLRALLRPKSWNRLADATKGRIDPALLDRLQPWFVALWVVHLAVPRAPQPGAVRPGLPPLDQQIDARARARKIPIEALESRLEHLQVMSRMDRKEGVAMVEEALARTDGDRAEFAGLVNAYVAEQDRPLMKTFGRLVRRKPALAERLLFRRNEAWIERLERWLGDGRMFVAAGTFHMFGERGLVALLRARGYRVERVRAASSPRSQ